MLTINAEWRDWLTTNVARGCSAQSILEAMIRNGFAPNDARALVEPLFAPAAPAAPTTPAVPDAPGASADAPPPAAPTLNAAWRDWLTTNVARGCAAQSMIDAMVQTGFSPDDARTVVEPLFAPAATADAPPADLPPAAPSADAPPADPPPAAPSVAAAPADPPPTAPSADAPPADRPTVPALDAAATPPQGGYVYDPTPLAAHNVIRAHDRDVRVLSRCERPQVVVFGDVLSARECEELIARARDRLTRSQVVMHDSQESTLSDYRTSEGTWFARGADPFIERLERRLAALMNWPVENGEGLQVLRYGVGAEYRPHHDYFAPDKPSSALHTTSGGQRVATLVIYLNDVPAGGETIFPDAHLSVAPQRGAAVYFRYANARGQLDPLSLHGGSPVREGEKWVMTKWVRERAYGG